MKRCILLPVLLLAMPSWARWISESWDHRKLTSEADLILIATPIRVAQTDQVEHVPSNFIGKAQPLQANVTLTTFVIRKHFKGPKQDGKVVLRHLRVPETLYPPIETMFLFKNHGFVSFDPAAKKSYLLFLKKLPNGEYASVSGQIDPGYGIEEVDTSRPFHFPQPENE